MLKNCVKPIKNIENRQTCRKFVEKLQKLPKTIKNHPKPSKIVQIAQIFKKTFRNVENP